MSVISQKCNDVLKRLLIYWQTTFSVRNLFFLNNPPRPLGLRACRLCGLCPPTPQFCGTFLPFYARSQKLWDFALPLSWWRPNNCRQCLSTVTIKIRILQSWIMKLWTHLTNLLKACSMFIKECPTKCQLFLRNAMMCLSDYWFTGKQPFLSGICFS